MPDDESRPYDPLEPPIEPEEPVNPAHTDLPGPGGEEASAELLAELEKLRDTDRSRREAEGFDLSTPLEELAGAPIALDSGGDRDETVVAETEPVEMVDLEPEEMGRRLIASWRAVAPAVADEVRLAREYEEAVQEETELRKSRRELPSTVDPHDLAETGWGVILSRDEDPAVIHALQPLLRRREEQARGRYKELTHHPNESARRFLWLRHGESPGILDPDLMPYYLLIVGGPKSIPFEFQYQLSINHAVGRIAFDDPSDYRRYAEAVVEAEEHGVELPREVALFSVRNGADRATAQLAEHLVKPLSERLAGFADWKADVWDEERSYRRDLLRLLGGDATPGLLLASCHGYPDQVGAETQPARQGALLCSDWPGRGHRVVPEHYVSGADLPSDLARLPGLVAFLFACYGAGTPFEDNYPLEVKPDANEEVPRPRILAREPFIARLPQVLLSRGALAVVGHIDRGWTTAFRWKFGKVATEAVRSLEDSVKQLLAGGRIGHALRPLARRYTAIASLLTETIERVQNGLQVDAALAAFEWTALNDSRNLILLGDPAVYLLGERCWHGDVETAGGERATVRLADDLAARVADQARSEGQTVDEWIDQALRRRLASGTGSSDRSQEGW